MIEYDTILIESFIFTYVTIPRLMVPEHVWALRAQTQLLPSWKAY